MTEQQIIETAVAEVQKWLEAGCPADGAPADQIAVLCGVAQALLDL